VIAYRIFFDALVLTSSDYRLSFKAIIDDPITRMPEFMRNILLFVMKVALEDPSITQATFTTRRAFPLILDTDDGRNRCLIRDFLFCRK